MAGAFLSGLINGFMSVGGGAAMAGAGGAGSAAGAQGAGAAGMAAGAQGASGAQGAGMGKSVDLPKATSPSGGENIGKTSQALSSGGSGDIVRTNPYGEGSVSAPSTSGTDTGKAFGKAMEGFQKGEAAMNHSSGHFASPSYNALFGMSMPKDQGMQQAPIAPVNAPALSPAISRGTVPPPTMMAPQAPSPMSLQMQGMAAPAPMQIQPTPMAPTPEMMVPPVPLPLGAQMSDRHSKKNISNGDKFVNKLLNDIYKEVINRKGNR